MSEQAKTIEDPISVPSNGAEIPPEDRLETLENTGPSESFSPNDVNGITENISELCDVADIEALQRKLHHDYKALAKQFSDNRITRVDAFIQKIEDLQAQLKKEYAAHELLVQENLPFIDPQTSVAVPSLKQIQAEKRKQFEQQAGFTVLDQHRGASSPQSGQPVSPKLSEMPIFPESFELVLKPYKETLQALRNKYNYDAKLIEQSAQRDVELIWKQSTKERIDARQKLRQKYIVERQQIEYDFNNISKYAKLSNSEKRYRASVRKVGEKRIKADLPHITKSIQRRSKKTPKIILNPQSLASATPEEIENDLFIMKNSPSSNIQLERYEANYKYMEQPLKRSPSYTKPTMTDIVNSRLEGGAKPSSMPADFSTQNQSVHSKSQSPPLFNTQSSYNQIPPPPNSQLYPYMMTQQQQMYQQQAQQQHQHQHQHQHQLQHQLQLPHQHQQHLHSHQYQMWQQQQDQQRLNQPQMGFFNDNSRGRNGSVSFQFSPFLKPSAQAGPPRGSFKN